MSYYKIVFRIRRIYFDQIVDGNKTVEIRRVSPHWERIAAKVFSLPPYSRPSAVFICGRRVHRRKITGIEMATSAEFVLGRPLSPQGMADVGTGPVFAFHLGEELPRDAQ